MATKKERKRSGFDGYDSGQSLPKGTKLRKNKDGTVTPVYPKKK